MNRYHPARQVRIASATLFGLFLILLPSIVAATSHGAAGPTNALQPVEDTKVLLADVAYYAKYLLPGVALSYMLYGAILRSVAGDDDMKKAKADRTMANAKWGLVLGFIAAPLALWLQKYFEH